MEISDYLSSEREGRMTEFGRFGKLALFNDKLVVFSGVRTHVGHACLVSVWFDGGLMGMKWQKLYK